MCDAIANALTTACNDGDLAGLVWDIVE